MTRDRYKNACGFGLPNSRPASPKILSFPSKDMVLQGTTLFPASMTLIQPSLLGHGKKRGRKHAANQRFVVDSMICVIQAAQGCLRRAYRFRLSLN
jgi:hypothetical protein